MIWPYPIASPDLLSTLGVQHHTSIREGCMLGTAVRIEGSPCVVPWVASALAAHWWPICILFKKRKNTEYTYIHNYTSLWMCDVSSACRDAWINDTACKTMHDMNVHVCMSDAPEMRNNSTWKCRSKCNWTHTHTHTHVLTTCIYLRTQDTHTCIHHATFHYATFYIAYIHSPHMFMHILYQHVSVFWWEGLP